ncbi:MAG: L,D-transpeptidase family protein [Huintestinicola sp.]
MDNKKKNNAHESGMVVLYDAESGEEYKGSSTAEEATAELSMVKDDVKNNTVPKSEPISIPKENPAPVTASEPDDDNDSDMSAMIASAIQKKKDTKRAEKKKQNIRTAVISASAFVFACIAVYFGGWAASMGGFLPNTYINNIEVSKMTVTQAVSALQAEKSSDYCLTVYERNGTSKQFPLNDFNYQLDVFSEVMKHYNEQSHAGWIKAYFTNTNLTVQTTPTYDSEKLIRLLKNTSWGTQETSDAILVHGPNGYYIQDEVYGDKADSNVIAEYVNSKVAEGILSVDLAESGCYTDPTVFRTELTENLAELNSKFNYVITLDFDYTQEVLTGADVYEWMGNGGVLDRTKVEAYVDKLAEKYDTFMKPRSFKTTNRGLIKLDQGRYSTGQYGWWIDKEKTVEQLIGYIDAGETITTDPTYVTLDTGYTYQGFESARSADGDIGNTYIEVDLTNQHLWYYQNGVLTFETDQIVSGKASDPKRKTPEGVYSVYTKSTNYTMRAADGSYTAKCAYFMRVSFEGIGFHDLSRTAYGGNIYLTNGSHGCINMKKDEVSKLYDMVERGTPVVFYY